jgi:hypothetical protein
MAVKNSHTLVCDEVRQENTGKFFVIGLYTGPIMVPQIPIPLALTFLHFLEVDRLGRFTVKFRVEHLESGRRLVEGQGNIQVVSPGLVLGPFRVPLQIDSEGAYNFILEVEGEREPIITPFTVSIVRQNFQPGMMPMQGPPMR